MSKTMAQHQDTDYRLVVEMREFAGFGMAEQAYICAALDIRLGRHRDRWNKTDWRRSRAYYDVMGPGGTFPYGVGPALPGLIRVSADDLAEGMLAGFPAYRFLYERVFGAAVRPILPSAFCAASALPNLPPARRAWLLQSLSHGAAMAQSWSCEEPRFFPETPREEVA